MIEDGADQGNVVRCCPAWERFVLKPLSDERRPFVGTWRLESPIFPVQPELVVEKDLMFDGTIIDRIWDPQAHDVKLNQPSLVRWHVSNGRYLEVIDENPLLRRLRVVSSGPYILLDSAV